MTAAGGGVMPEKYVIINENDAPQPNMVCQWVEGVGYCYLDRTNGKPDFDGMHGQQATPVAAFGFIIVENSDGTVTFYTSGNPSTATYIDGAPRRWQSHVSTFEYRRLEKSRGRKRAKRMNVAVEMVQSEGHNNET